MSPIGTKLPFWDVRYPVATEGKSDIAPRADLVAIDPQRNLVSDLIEFRSLGIEASANQSDPIGFHCLNVAPLLRRLSLAGLG